MSAVLEREQRVERGELSSIFKNCPAYQEYLKKLENVEVQSCDIFVLAAAAGATGRLSRSCLQANRNILCAYSQHSGQ